jgi:hypothetical protein
MRLIPFTEMEFMRFDEGLKRANECSDKIWVSQAEFTRLQGATASAVILVELCGPSGQRAYGGLQGIHREADPNAVYVPRWIYDWFGGIYASPEIRLERVHLNLCTSLTLQPILLDNSNLAVFRSAEVDVLQKGLRRYSCIRRGQVYTFLLEGQEYRICILDTKPGAEVVCIKNCDIELQILNAWIPMHILLRNAERTAAAAAAAAAPPSREPSPFHAFAPHGRAVVERTPPMPETGGRVLDPTAKASSETPEELRHRVAEAARKRLARSKSSS